MSEEQFDKAKNIIDRINNLKNSLERVTSDIIEISKKYSYEKYVLQGTSLILLRDDVIKLLCDRRVWINSELEFLRKQLKSI